MHTLCILRSHFELPRDGGDLDILEKDSAGKIWKLRCCSARVTRKPVIFGGWVFFVPNQMSSKQRSACFL
ncbi:hypothetical protein SLEP1_g12743 [Rubroshorea leprosula]|uniref:Uncharacterized protein n=1 Tax=Rubroshorea leprosula TaxID=152421 RepID=A0AAV5IMY2_9ROSI|nr:hypothetical protein SLEP1_g12743 [Rubroshorea leprosula]